MTMMYINEIRHNMKIIKMIANQLKKTINDMHNKEAEPIIQALAKVKTYPVWTMTL